MAQTAPTTIGADSITAAGLLLLGVLLFAIGGGFLDQWQETIARNRAFTVEHLLGMAATAAGAVLLLWWLVSLACAAGSLILEKRGNERAAAAARRMSPQFMRRLVIGAVSFQLLSGGVAHAAAPGPEWVPTSQGQESNSPMAIENAPARTQTKKAAAPTEPEAVASPAPASTIEPRWQPSAPVVDPGPLAAPAVRGDFSSPATGGQAGPVAVLTGDSLWDIVANHLGHGASDVDIALEWPRWYEANKGLIGQNPDVLLPGQILLPPAPA